MSVKVFIIGGGAAGFFAAIRAAEVNPEAEICILEKGKEVLSKVRISGGGRCNVTHACWEPRELVKYYPRGSRELLGPFHRFACGDTVEWFGQRGVELKIEEDGRMFPVTDSSQTILDCLQDNARDLGVKVMLGERVEKLAPPESAGSRWLISTKNNTYEADRVVITTGSNPAVWGLVRDLGHTIVPPVPSLFTFNIADERIEALPGLSVPQARVRIEGSKLEATGPLLITHWGMSGPAVLKLSAWGARELNDRKYHFNILVNWINRSEDDLREDLNKVRQSSLNKQITARSQFGLPQRLWRSLLQAAGVSPDARWADLSKKNLQQMVEQLSRARFEVKGKSTFKEEFVTAGGVDLREVNFKTFESRLLPGLFFAGEVLNIDAVTGGFNFQAAWTGGWIAGSSLVH